MTNDRSWFFLSAVVAYELYVNARNRYTRSLVQEFIKPMVHVGRVVCPTFDDWVAAAELVTPIEENDRIWRSKLPTLLNDALCAGRIGATVLTHNKEDFRLIHRHKDFSLTILEQ